MASPLVKQFTDANWEAEVLGSEVPVMVDFTAVWCGPCKAIAPYVDQIATDYEGRVKVGKVDVDHNRKTAETYRVHSIPAVFMFKGGRPVGQLIGAMPKARFVQLVEDAMKA